MWAALAAGIGIGALGAANIGPIWLLCMRTSVRFGWRPGAAIGLGAASIDLAYATLGALGAAALLQIGVLRVTLGVVGAAVLVYLGGRTLHDAVRIRLGLETNGEVVQPRQALRTGLVATASNPLTILTWAAVFSGAAAADVAASPGAAAAFVLGIGLGSAAFHLALAVASAAVGGRVGPRAMRVIDVVSGLGLVAFGAVLGVRTVREG